ncbi:hypothetical protein F443_16929 [Plasmopara halstedii]|uniref:FYVE-type domain-containing protein n=1 Tax=Plasmopara halstedii TaxID=4781 RepID=A0A0N7L5T3_PLAHL|nr:hypothetical protein F443_16929 [Plasmopara halstedii]CEG42355.1 hypothetical protein F443_16929 [Plasmopara halstedii]|eukprot:XP_024578724.1 hypothetical protein F443_16929 [Plasmopara halstedii]
MQLRFPLPASYFPKFEIVPSEVQSYQSLASDIVRETKRDFEHYVKDGRNSIDVHTWKLVKSKERLHCYRKQGKGSTRSNISSVSSDNVQSRPSLSISSSQDRSGLDDMNNVSVSVRSSDDGEPSRKSIAPTVIGYGILDGTVDDIVYGLYQTSSSEMKTLSKFLGDDSLIDCAVLQTIRQTRSSYLGLKWKLSRTVGGNRDCCYMEYTGISEDLNGQRFGYHVLESVKVRSCPHFNDNSIVRTNMSFCFLFRPGKLVDQVEVFMEGAYDSSADLLSAGGVGDYRNSMEIFFNLSKAMIGAEAKKISALVVKQSDALKAGSSRNQSGNNCFICRSKMGLLSSRTNCQICGAIICSKCRIQKITLSHQAKAKVSCCKMCMVKVKDHSPFAGDLIGEQLVKPTKKSLLEDRYSYDKTKVRMDMINASVSTLSLTDSDVSSSYQSSWQSGSISLTQSDLDDSSYSSNINNAMMSLDRKMPALMESEQSLVTYHGKQQPLPEQQQFQQQVLMRQQMKQNPVSNTSRQHQFDTRQGLYNQMLELQVQAERTYNLTNQNASMMHSRR